MSATTRDRPGQGQRRTDRGADPLGGRPKGGDKEPRRSGPRSLAAAIFGRTHPTGADGSHACTLVWIDAREAVIIRWDGGGIEIDRLESDVPAHHRATGHVRHDPTMRHGGGGGSQTAGEPHRLEHLARFVAQAASHVSPDDDLIVLGPGTVREHFERYVRVADRRRGCLRDITGEASPRRTDRQLAARLRHAVGADPRRREVGGHRWTEPPVEQPSGRMTLGPRRVVEKRSARPSRRTTVSGGEPDGE